MTNDLPFIDPTAGGKRPRITLAPRPIDLAGKVVGMIDNSKEQADVILAAAGEVLQSRHGAAKVIILRKEHYSKPAPAAMIDELAREVQVAVAALGG
jgi:hypothetical protein